MELNFFKFWTKHTDYESDSEDLQTKSWVLLFVYTIIRKSYPKCMCCMAVCKLTWQQDFNDSVLPGKLIDTFPPRASLTLF